MSSRVQDDSATRGDGDADARTTPQQSVGDDKKREGSMTNNDDSDDESTKCDSTTKNGSCGGKRRKAGNTHVGGNNRQRDNDCEGREKKNKKQKFTRRQDDDDWEDKPPHDGSYASPEMQKLFGITLKKKSIEMNKVDSSHITGDLETTKSNEQSSSSSRNKEDARNTPQQQGEGVKYPKRKVALLIAFIGEAYSGMQINAGQRTIQAELEFALYKAGYLTESNFGHPHKYGWSNSARTDKGVHSCAQVCSLKINLPPPDNHTMDDVRENINANLPDDIRVLDVVRTSRNFCARTQRDRVRYQYMIPGFVLRDRETLRSLFESRNCHLNGRPLGDPLSSDEIDSLLPELTGYRIDEDALNKLRGTLKMFEGTHSFHNYTNGKTSSDPSCSRYILSFDAQDPVIGPNGMEWIPTQVLGQSFLLHQIRKMISMAVDVARGATTSDVMLDSFSKKKQMKLGIAPAQGLFLDMSYFDSYNKRRNQDLDPLDWSSDEQSRPAAQRWKAFKEEKVMRHIMEEESRQFNFLKYIFVQEFAFGRENYLFA